MPRSTAFCLIRSRFKPAPSSEISMFTCPPSWKARKVRQPSAGLPRATRVSGLSTPWSTVFRTRCVSGSLMASMMVLSSSVSLPSISMRTCLPQVAARSRTNRGNLLHTLPICCIRVFITPSCNSVVMRFNRCDVPSREASPRLLVNCTIWFRASTNSPTRVISLSSRATSTRIVLSAADALWTSAAGEAAG